MAAIYIYTIFKGGRSSPHTVQGYRQSKAQRPVVLQEGARVQQPSQEENEADEKEASNWGCLNR